MTITTLRLSRGSLLIGPPGEIPSAMLRASDRMSLPGIISRLPTDRAAMGLLRSNWLRIAPGTHVRSMSDADLMNQLARMLRGGRLLIIYMPDHAGSFSAPRLSENGIQGQDWSRADKVDKVAEALRRSKDHVGQELYAVVADLVSPTNIAIMVGFIVAVAIAHATGVAGATIDAVLIGLAWVMAGFAGVKAIVNFIGAIIDVMDAKTDAEIDRAARAFAAAFVALGAAFLARMLAKAKMNNRTSAAPKPKAAPAKTSPRAAQRPATSANPPKPKSLREQYMGRTPGKNSRTGREVMERMRSEGTQRTDPRTGVTRFKASNGKWYPLNEADMAHKTDAVSWWNSTGRSFGAKSQQVRDFMLDSKNYVLDHFSLNRSAGAVLGQSSQYLPPLPGR